MVLDKVIKGHFGYYGDPPPSFSFKSVPPLSPSSLEFPNKLQPPTPADSAATAKIPQTALVKRFIALPPCIIKISVIYFLF